MGAVERRPFVRFVFVWTLVRICCGQEDVICTEQYCETYITQNTCAGLPDFTDHEIHRMDSPTPCNCCNYYLLKLKNNESCVVGSPGSPAPSGVCGDALFCTAGKSEAFCSPMDTKCTKDQKDWETRKKEGTLGNMEMKPKCDRKGLYQPVKCIPGQTCYCLSEDGERIFGEAPFVPDVDFKMKCDCARKFKTATDLLGGSDFRVPTSRCLPNGNYDPLQCVDDSCMCVGEFNGVPSVVEWYKKPVNVSDISGKTLEFCFDKKIHKRGVYLRECETRYIEVKEELMSLQENGTTVLGVKLPRCQPDGYFDRLQETYLEKYCADIEGNQIGDYSVAKTSPLAETMNCNCARAVVMLEEDGDYIDLPTCCANGNYAQLQCRKNECRCVDADGNQIGKQVYEHRRSELDCYNDGEVACTEQSRG